MNRLESWPAIRRRLVLVLALLGLAGPGASPAGAEEKLALDPASLPPRTTVVKIVELTEAQVAVISKRLGAPLSRVTNEIVALAGTQAQVNLVECATEADAERCFANLARVRKDATGGGLGRRSRVVVEVTTSCNALLAKRLLAAANALPPGSTTYRARFRVACADEVEAERANEVFNLFRSSPAPDPVKVRALTSDWKLGSSLALWTGKRAYYEARFDLAPAPVASTSLGESTRFTFEKAPVLVGIPYVDVSATIRVSNAHAPSGGERPDASLTAPTPAWPASAERVKELSRGLTSGCKTDLERTLAIHAHVQTSIAQRGPRGTRYGVEKVLRQGFGNCWDKSDVLVTLCRAAGVPAREIAGWVPVLDGGHVWAEVYVEGGWLPVDATTPWLGASDDYVPWFSTSDGRMPIAYLANPSIQRGE